MAELHELAQSLRLTPEQALESLAREVEWLRGERKRLLEALREIRSFRGTYHGEQYVQEIARMALASNQDTDPAKRST